MGARSRGGGLSQPWATTFFDNPRTATLHTSEDAVSTFSLDTDRTSYRLALNWARQGFQVDPDSVRAEEWVNSFDYGYKPPAGENELGIYSDVFKHPLDDGKHLVRIAFQAPHLRDSTKPLNVTLVLDASGSMAEGSRVDIARAAAESIRRSLREQDRIAVVQFSQGVLNRLTVKHTHPDDRDVGRSINRLRPNGSTNVQAGLDLGMKLADRARRQRPDAHNDIVLMSDGVANVDATNPFAILETAGDYEQQNPVRLITIGLGIANYNDYLLEQLAQHGNGWYRYLDSASQAESLFERDSWLSLATPFADQARAQVTWDPEFVRSWRIVGYENRVTADEHFAQARKEFAEIPSGVATTVVYELELHERSYREENGPAWLGSVQVRWVSPGTGAPLQQHAPVLGDRGQTFEGLTDPMLKLGALVALFADRYSALPGVHNLEHGAVFEELANLRQKLRALGEQLGHLTAYEDLVFLLDHMAWQVPFEPGGFVETGYSP